MSKFFHWLQWFFGVATLVLLGIAVQFQFKVAEKYLPIERIKSVSVAGTSLGKVLNEAPPQEIASQVDFSVFWEAWNLLQQDFNQTDKLDPVKMTDGAIAGMTASLGDPYTMYLNVHDNERTGQDLAGAFFGVGIELGYVDGVLAVISPLKGSPAEAAGVQAGDLIIRVKDVAKDLDVATVDWTIMEAVDAIRGPEGSPVVLTLFRKENGNEPFEVSINRGEIVVKSVELEFVESGGKKSAHVSVSRFGGRTMQEWDLAVAEILSKRSEIDGIVIDFRNDPGGFFDDALKIASDFIPSGTIVTQRGRYNSQSFSSTGIARLVDIPVVVLVNRGSASASEIVAGALRDRLGAPMVGEKTFGKGTVQDRRELSNGGALHVTIARWELPGGDWIHETGIPVDKEITDDRETPADEALNAAIEML
ncbi:MAG: hypothetical protein COU65_04475 [Candidatus Pacebacteria bacterium CG10_big_fil_rev_8_21_14_0_10_42_12]|nr:S41 family peptidase [Candidatus Paceibacterota bacterium]PIR62222.1 MAG: hypothetical protein COU65_04475 [Candidatus Pacebacteria bacterium CG10_big_fil_rev_8_21_14_0_10_42_12]